MSCRFRRRPKKAPALSPGRAQRLQELARELSARLKNTAGKSAAAPAPHDFGRAEPRRTHAAGQHASRGPRATAMPPRDTHEGRPILDRLPVGILVYRLNKLIYANRAFLDWTGYPSLDALAEAGGLDSLFIETKSRAAGQRTQERRQDAHHHHRQGKQKPVEGRLFSAPWNSENALVLMLSTQAVAEDRGKAEMSLRRLRRKRRAQSILDTATDGVLVLDRAGRMLSANRSAEALFGYEAAKSAELSFGDLFAPESRRAVLDYLDRLAQAAPAMLDTGREAIGLVRQGGLVPLFMTLGRIADGEKFCAMLRDITAWKRTEEELINAKRQAEQASTAKSEFLAKISHEIRTPLNAIIGFSEVMMDERFGPIGNERYRQYLKDIHTSGGHLVSLLNDLLDLSKIEAGKLELTFVSVNLNELVQQCVAIMQPQANRERIIIRTSLPPNLPQIVADARSVRQIALNLLSNSIKFTGAGGQVIVSTARERRRRGGVARARHRRRHERKGIADRARAVPPARHFGALGLGRHRPRPAAHQGARRGQPARFRITSQVDDGTLVEVPSRRRACWRNRSQNRLELYP